MPFNPINYGNIAAQGENILAARRQRDPNSPQNQLLQEQLLNARHTYGEPQAIGDTGMLGQRDRNGRIVQTFAPPKAAKLPNLLEEYKGALQGRMIPPDTTLEGYIQMKKPPGNSMTMTTGDPETFDQQYHKKMMEGYIEQAKGAGERLTKINQGKSVLKLVNTGKWESTKLEAAKFFGVDPSTFANQELFDVMMGDFVMARIQQTKGAVSEKEMAYFDRISPSIGKSKYANWALLEINRRGEMRNRDKPRHYSEYLKSGAREHFDDWYMANKDPFGEFDPTQLEAQFEREFGSAAGVAVDTGIYTDEQYQGLKKKWGL